MKDWSKRIAQIKKIAEDAGWEDEIANQPNICMLSFSDTETRINIYYSKMTIGIIPKGKPAIYKYYVSMNRLEKIFNTEDFNKLNSK